ncbi:MAG: NAD-binding protein [Bacteroidales bacterium]|nr:NAD-binding protein [Bacteroidales bacterium]
MKWFKFIRNRWMYVLSLAIFSISLVAFIFSKSVIANSQSLIERILVSAYDSFSLFVFGGIDIGFPKDESLWIKIVLWLSYFTAPLISVNYLTSLIQKRFFDSIPKKITKHAAILGFGRNGSLLYDIHREMMPMDNIIIVDKIAPENKNEVIKNPSTWLIEKDFLNIETLKSIKIDKSDRIYITTNKDFINVVCLSILLDYFENRKMPKIICQISDPFFRKDIEKLYKTANKSQNVIFYNGYKSACEYLLQKYIALQLSNEERYLHIFLGYGNFAFSLQEVMLGTKTFTEDHFIIGTKRKDDSIHNKWINEIELKITKQYINCDLVISDIYNYDFWQTCHQRAITDNRKIVFYICTDDELSNMQLAIMLKQSNLSMLNNSLIFIRAFRPFSGMFKSLTESQLSKGEQKDIIVLPVSESLSEGFKKILNEN